MNHTATPSDWVAFLSLGVSGWAVMAAVIWLTADAEAADFDPRPLARRALNAAHQGAVYAGHDLNRGLATSQRAAREARRAAAVSVAGLLLLLSAPTAGGNR